MSTLMPLLRTRATLIWAVLVAATVLSWLLGTGDRLAGGDARTLASVLILLVAFIKVRLVGLYFMELRDAPILLRGLFEGYCLVVCAVVLGMFLIA